MQGTKKNLDNWRDFAERLTRLAATEGRAQFLDQAFFFLNEIVPMDSCAVFKVSADKTTGAVHLCTFGNLNAALATQLAEEYVSQGFKNDPMVQTAVSTKSVRVRHLPETQYSASYRSQFFEKAGLSDKVSSIHSSKNVLFLVNFYRKDSQGKFSIEEIRDLQTLGPIIGRFVLRHIQIKSDPSELEGSLNAKISSLVTDTTQAFSVLSNREQEICKKLLLGKSEKEIANECNLSVNTIITHRRRSYEKLCISSKTELFQLALCLT